MTNEESIKILEGLDKYYGGKIITNPIVLTVWTKMLLPMPLEDGMAIAEFAVEKFQWIPSIQTLREEFAVQNGTSFKQELSDVIAVFSRRDSREMANVPRSIWEATNAAGGIQKMANASEKDFPALERKFIAARTKAQAAQRLTVLTGGKQRPAIGGNK